MDQMLQTEAKRQGLDLLDLRGEPERRQSVRRPGKRRRRWLIAGIAVLVAGGVVAWGVMDRQNNLSQEPLAKTIDVFSLVKL